MSTKRFATALSLTLALTAGCTDPTIDQDTLDSREDGVLGRLFGTLSSFFEEKAEEPAPIAPISEPWSPPEAGEDPAVDELFAALGLEEVDPGEGDMDLDGALVGIYEHFPDDDDPDDFYDEVCFFAKSHDQMPSQEALFYAEMYGFRASNGQVSDIDGRAIDEECVWCEEGNVGGGETRVIFYVNGIKTDTDKHCDTLQSIADTTGAVTIGVFNESEGTVKDIWQTAGDRFTVTFENALAKFGIEQAIKVHENKSADMLMNLVIQRIRADKHVEIWAHSQGGAVTSLALHRALRQLESEGSWPVYNEDGEVDYAAIKVVTFGSAAPQWPFGGFPKGPSYTHYVHLRDATPSALGVGAWGGYATFGEKRAGADAKMVFFDGDPAVLEEMHPDDKTPVFDEIPLESANIGFLELEPKKYHDIETCYLGMFQQQHGTWYK